MHCSYFHVLCPRTFDSRGRPGDAGGWAGGQQRRGWGMGRGLGGQGFRHVRLRIQGHAHEWMSARMFVMSEKTLRSLFAGLCASRVGAAQPKHTDVASLDETAFAMGRGWRSASLVMVEDEAPALDTVVVDPQGALDINVQVASESESAGVFTATVVHVHCANVRKHRDALHACAHKCIHSSARAIAL
jgi:hypothetical protein